MFPSYAACQATPAISETLEEILKDYDEMAYPSRDGKRVNVSVQIHIEDMMPTERKAMVCQYNLDLYTHTFF